jgi:vesicle-fusing ATPase
MRENQLLEEDVDLYKLAIMTKNYTGAEIEAVCRGATQFALFKDFDMTQISGSKTEESKKDAKKAPPKKGGATELVCDRKVCMADFLRALGENKPAFGIDNENLSNCVRGGIIPYGESFNKIYKDGINFISEIKNSKSTPLLSILLEGRSGCGKTALAAKLAIESKFPYVKMITPENFVGYSE